MNLIVLVVLLLLIFGSFPAAPWYGNAGAPWGYYPMGGFGLILLVLVIVALLRGV